MRHTDDVIPDVNVVDGLFAQRAGDAPRAYESFLKGLRAGGYYERKHLKRLRPVALLAAESALAAGRLEDALRLSHEAFEIARVDDLADAQSAFTGEARLMEGRVWLGRGDTTTARAALEKAATALRNGAGANDSRTREAERLLATP